MSILDLHTLSLESKNTVVSEFSSLVENASAKVSSVASTATSQLGVVSTASSFVTGKYTTSTMSKLNAYAKNTKFVGKSFASVKNNFNFTSAASTAASGTSNAFSKINAVANNHLSDVSQTLAETKLDKDLYDKALSLPEAKTVSLSLSSESNRQYGTFVGSTIFKDFNGTIDDSIKNVQQISGWVTLNNRSENYAWITNNGQSYIVGINSVQPQPIVEDMQPLYDRLKENQYATDELVVKDTQLASSKAATFKEASSEAINSYSEDTEKFVSGTLVPTDPETGKLNKPKSWDTEAEKYTPEKLLGVIYPKQVQAKTTDLRNDSVYNNVQAVVYDLVFKDDEQNPAADGNSNFDKANTILLCYQQPENISYTAAAQFDSPSTRGTQQPFQFYVQANAMSLSFTLRWHIDEIRTLMKESGKAYSIQDIAQIAEDFTRPWKRGDSIEPKLCKVILPGIQHIGYITEAQISYSGDMSGDYATGGGVLSGRESARGITNYFYSLIDVTFSMIIIKDITLRQKTDPKRDMFLAASDGSVEEAPQNNKPETDNDVKSNSGNQEAPPVSSSSASSNVDNDAIYSSSSSSVAIGNGWYSDNVNGQQVLINQDAKVYTSSEHQDGFFVASDGDEVFMANGQPQPITSQDEQGNKYYTDESGQQVLAGYMSGGTDHIYDQSGGVCSQVGP